MRGHLQSTNRRLNRHWQSGGKSNFFITTSGTATESSRCNGRFTKNPSVQVTKKDDKLVLELTPVKAERNGVPVSIPVIYAYSGNLGSIRISFGGVTSYRVVLRMEDPSTYEFNVPTSGDSLNPDIEFYGPFNTTGPTVFKAYNIGANAPSFPSSAAVFASGRTNIVYKRAVPNPEETTVYYKYRLYVEH